MLVPTKYRRYSIFVVNVSHQQTWHVLEISKCESEKSRVEVYHHKIEDEFGAKWSNPIDSCSQNVSLHRKQPRKEKATGCAVLSTKKGSILVPEDKTKISHFLLNPEGSAGHHHEYYNHPRPKSGNPCYLTEDMKQRYVAPARAQKN